MLQFKSEKDKGLHPTIKPIALMEFLVRSYTNENDIIVDPFCGSGSTGVACINTGRKFIGVEKEKAYFDIAVQRIEEAYAESTGVQDDLPELVDRFAGLKDNEKRECMSDPG